LTNSALRDDSSLVRSAAAASLVRIAPDLGPVVPWLIAALREPGDVRNRAAGLLSRATPVAIEPLLATLKDPDEGVRDRARDALGGMGRPAAPKLVEPLNGPDPALRRAPAYPLPQVGA